MGISPAVCTLLYSHAHTGVPIVTEKNKIYNFIFTINSKIREFFNFDFQVWKIIVIN